MLDKIFNRKYLKAMKRIDLHIEQLSDAENEYVEARDRRSDELLFEKDVLNINDWQEDWTYRQLDYMCNYMNHKKIALLELRADLLTYVS